jgi:hypothetical protein
MVGKLTRRVFLSFIGALPLIHAVSPKMSSSVQGQGSESLKWLDEIDYVEQDSVQNWCPECGGGLGPKYCQACDGTGLWSEASESAGLYNREWARKTGKCAWCIEGVDAVCTLCEGRGVVSVSLN